tara:strand:- start:10988 stop:11323 length:336 start_codon:yes stop_codon:yes gene_type:complete
MEYLITGSYITSASAATLVTAGASKKLLLKTIHITNITSSNAQVTLKWKDTSASNKEYFIAKDVVVPQASSFQAIDGTMVLDNNDLLTAQSDLSGSLQATVSYMEIDNSEG